MVREGAGGSPSLQGGIAGADGAASELTPGGATAGGTPGMAPGVVPPGGAMPGGMPGGYGHDASWRNTGDGAGCSASERCDAGGMPGGYGHDASGCLQCLVRIWG